jgi:hypothetical protein
MTLNDLLSRYLDGELTHDEDAVLRQMLASDPQAREAFDTAVLLHVHMQCEPAEPPCPTLWDSIEAATVAQPLRASTMGLQRPISRSKRRLVAVAYTLAALLCVAPVHHMMFNLNDTMAGGLPELQTIDGNQQSETRAGNLNGVQAPSTAATPPSVKVVEDLSADGMAGAVQDGDFEKSTIVIVAEMLDTQPEQIHEVEPQQTPTLRSFLGSSNMGSQPNGQTNWAAISEPSSTRDVAESSNTSESVSQRAPVHVEASYNTSVSTSASHITNVQQVSQSTGFVLASSTVVGIEVGVTSYTLAYSGNVETTSESAAAGRRSTENVSDYQQTIGTNEPSNSFVVPSAKLAMVPQQSIATGTQMVRGSRAIQQLWGSAFAQFPLLELANVDILARAGVGLGEDGVTSYSRLTAEYALAKGVGLLLGAEARGMQYRVGTVNSMASATSFGLSIGVSTGIRIEL